MGIASELGEALKIAATSKCAVDDSILRDWLAGCLKRKADVVLVYAQHSCAVYSKDMPEELLITDPADEHVAMFKQLAKNKKFSRIEVNVAELDTAISADPSWTDRSIPASVKDVSNWYKSRKALFDPGRGKALNPRSIQRVWHDAGGRCMYRGCADDLGITPLTEKLAAVAYLAHIVAADKDGPRGDDVLSEKLANDPENIMLMCDKHHRLIDRIAVEEYSTNVLRAMRKEHTSTVKKLLNALKYPDITAIGLFANIGNAASWMSETDMMKAMINRGLKPPSEITYPVSRIQRDDRSSIDAWRSILHDHEPDIRALVSQFSNVRLAVGKAEVLAIFPIHLVPILVLCGRVIGQARRVEIFHFQRDLGTWDFSSDAIPKAPGEFYVERTRSNPSRAMLLSIELTAEFHPSALPPELFSALEGDSMQWVRIRARTPDQNVIAHPEDLEQFSRVAREAVNLVQDRLHATHVHLIGVAPASTLFNFGQLLQAGNHCSYTIYDKPHGAAAFRPAITIDGNSVSNTISVGDVPKTVISLR